MELESTEHTGDGEYNYVLEKLYEADPFVLDGRFLAERGGPNGSKNEKALAEDLQDFLTKNPYKRAYYPNMALKDAAHARERRASLQKERPEYEKFNTNLRKAMAGMSRHFPQDLKGMLDRYYDADHEMQRERASHPEAPSWSLTRKSRARRARPRALFYILHLFLIKLSSHIPAENVVAGNK